MLTLLWLCLLSCCQPHAALMTGAGRTAAAARLSSSLNSHFAAVRAPVPIMMPPRRPRQQRAPPPKDNTPINDKIEFDTVRVVVDVPGAADETLGVMSKAEALAEAQSRSLDLVLIGAKSETPVCKIVSFDKFRFNREKKKKEQQKAVKGQELKELKLSYKIGQHDFDVRYRAAERFLNGGDKVKFSILFKGREISHTDVAKSIMDRMAESLVEVGVVDGPAKVNGRQMIMTVAPKQKNK